MQSKAFSPWCIPISFCRNIAYEYTFSYDVHIKDVVIPCYLRIGMQFLTSKLDEMHANS